jgi:hypothetical protein
MKTVTIEVDPESAKDFLANIENKISEKLRAREELGAEIIKLEESAKNMRTQLQVINGARTRRPYGTNRVRIREYLEKLPEGKGAKMTEISKSTGISVSSTAYTLRNYKKDFEQDKEIKSLWTLKRKEPERLRLSGPNGRLV